MLLPITCSQIDSSQITESLHESKIFCSLAKIFLENTIPNHFALSVKFSVLSTNSILCLGHKLVSSVKNEYGNN